MRRLLSGLGVGLVFLVGLCRATPAAPPKVTLTIAPETGAAVRGAATGLVIRADIARGWHIHGHQPSEPYLIATDLTFTLPPGVSIDRVVYPPPASKTFRFAGGKALLVYEGRLVMTAALTLAPGFSGEPVRIAAALHYQACNDASCLPPATATAEVQLAVRDSGVMAPAKVGEGAAAPAPTADVGTWLAERGLGATLLLVVLVGLGLNLTPCVYPLISVTVAFFGMQGHHSRLRVAGVASLYVLGITSTFAFVGVVAAFSGGLFGAALQQPLVLLAIAAMMVVLALSSFGLYQLQPPLWMLRRVGGSVPGAVGALLMGLTMGVVAAPCVGPVVLGLLVFVGSRQSVLLGFELFFALGLGMGLPYLVLAMVAGSIKALPRSGDWLMWVEHGFGFMLLGLSLWFVAPLLPASLKALALPALLLVAGLYLGFLDRSGRRLRHFRWVQGAVGVAAMVIAVWLGWPRAAESTIRWQPFDATAMTVARQAGRPVLIAFVADWCIPCHEMERTTYANREVCSEAERFAMLKADLTHSDESTNTLTARYQVQGVPTLIFVDGRGAEVHRLVGYVGAAELLAAMREVR